MTENLMVQDSSLISNFYKINPDIKKKYKIKKVKFALSEHQRNELLDIAEFENPKYYLIIKTFLETGMRVNELRNLIISQVNFREKFIKIESREATRYAKSWKPKTISGNRIVPINKELATLLKTHIGKRREGYVFNSNKADQYAKQSLIRIINTYANKIKSIGHNIGSHALRRTFASYLMNQTSEPIQIVEISKVLGHKNIKTTMIYLYDIVDLSGFVKMRKAITNMNK